MRIEGEWRETPTTVPRPYVRAHVEAHDGTWIECVFLVDTGADCTVISADVTQRLGRPTVPAVRQLGGVGGAIETLEVRTTLRLTGTAGERFNIAGAFATPANLTDAVTDSILGYDILHLFALVVDRTNDTVCLLRPPHRYTIHG